MVDCSVPNCSTAFLPIYQWLQEYLPSHNSCRTVVDSTKHTRVFNHIFKNPVQTVLPTQANPQIKIHQVSKSNCLMRVAKRLLPTRTNSEENHSCPTKKAWPARSFICISSFCTDLAQFSSGLLLPLVLLSIWVVRAKWSGWPNDAQLGLSWKRGWSWLELGATFGESRTTDITFPLASLEEILM